MWYNTIGRALRQVGIGLLAASLAFGSALGQSSLLPDGKQQFLSNTGVPLASGKVFMYVPNTTTFKNTWQDAAQVTLNTNPVILDASGRALIYGSGIYRQLVQTSAGVPIYDALTTSTLGASDVSFFYGNATSTGSANAQIVAATTPATFALTTGYTLTFKPGFANTGATQINVASTGLRNLLKPSSGGPTALTGGELVANQVVQAVYDGTQFVLNTSLPPSEIINAQSGTTYTFLNSDNGKFVRSSNVAAQAYTLPQAGAAGQFLAGWFVDVGNRSSNQAGIVTITPTTSTIEGAPTYVMPPGGAARITTDGVNYFLANQQGFLIVSTQVFTASGTYNRRSGLVYAIIECLGAGASGAGGTGTAGTTNSGGGGGAGGYARAVATAATIGASQTVTIGAGGTAPAAGNTNGVAGGNTSFGAICAASGGTGGTFGASSVQGIGGVGGIGTIGAFLANGARGLSGTASTITTVGVNGGAGGSSLFGGGGNQAIIAPGGTSSVAGGGAVIYGSGGAGGANINQAATFAGGNGIAGVVIVTEFSTQ